ncbi:hypothetical protein HED50_08145 [Ochrobactrum oryzae]|nr:hypothetical protein [Brucella oryzae]
MSGMEVPEAELEIPGFNGIFVGELTPWNQSIGAIPAFQHSQCRATNMRNGLTNVKSFFASVQ